MSTTDCRTPVSTAEQITNSVMAAKANAGSMKLWILGILAGVYIGFGAEVATLVSHDASGFLGVGVTKLIAGGVFSVGLMMVVIAGAELFTGNNLIALSVLQKKASLSGLFRNWTIVYFANFVGSLLLVSLIVATGLWAQNHFLTGALALKIANVKVNLTFMEAFTRAILCNWLVCIAVWMAVAARTVVGKVFAIFFPIMVFVASGYEHCIANMYFIPKGMWLKSVPEVVSASGLSTEQLSNLTMKGFLVNNLLPVTLGNIIGAVVFVALFYWMVYMRGCGSSQTTAGQPCCQQPASDEKELAGSAK